MVVPLRPLATSAMPCRRLSPLSYNRSASGLIDSARHGAAARLSRTAQAGLGAGHESWCLVVLDSSSRRRGLARVSVFVNAVKSWPRLVSNFGRDGFEPRPNPRRTPD